MNRVALFCVLLNVSGMFMKVVTAGVYYDSYKKSCLEIQKSTPKAVSGLYDIVIDDAVLTVYCEMAKYGGGYTFVPRESVRRGKFPSLISQLCTDPWRVLLRFQQSNGLQPFTLITQLPQYAKQKIGLSLHQYTGYTKPVNSGLGDYIFLGILPANVANKKGTTQGFRSNDKPVTFTNCDGTPHSYFALFPNHQEGTPSSYLASNLVFERQGVAVHWRNTGIPSYAHRQLPNNFLFFTEMHFGGCGTYTSSDRWTNAFGTAIGFR